MLILLSMLLYVCSLGATVFWQTSMNALTFSRSKPGVRERFELRCKKLSLILISLEFLIIVLAGCFASLDIWDVLAMVLLIPIFALLVKSAISKQPLFSLKLHSNKVINFIVIDLALHYLYVFIWIKSIVYFLGGSI